MSYKIKNHQAVITETNNPNGLSRGNKPDRFTANFWLLNAPKCSRVFLRHRSVIMAPEHGGQRHFSEGLLSVCSGMPASNFIHEPGLPYPAVSTQLFPRLGRQHEASRQAFRS